MRVGAKSRRRKLETLLACCPYGHDESFRDFCGKIAKARPDVGADDVLWFAVLFVEQTAARDMEQADHDRATIAAERARILRIIVAAFGGMDNVPDIIRVALNLAFETALCADEAIRALDAHQASHPQGGVLWS